MMYNFCTLFDTHYLSRGLALYESLKNHCESFHIYIFAFNNKCYEVLRKLNLSDATIISLKDFEDEELLGVKPSRTIAEYCWTSTSSTILYVLEKFNVESCTYLDADLLFYSSPEPIFDEMGDASILITEHRYSPQYNKEIKSGKYCVQFVTFKNDERGLKALKWWRDRCIEWCYARYEDGKFGDQLYLDDWTERFEGVHVLENPGGGLAAWNVQQYEFSYLTAGQADLIDQKETQLTGESIAGVEKATGKKFIVIFYHFHYLKFFKNGKIELGRRTLNDNVLNIFYKPYIQHLDKIKEQLKEIDNTFDPHGAIEQSFSWKTPVLFLYRKLKGVYYIFDKEKFLGN